jgi:hypothetical protein
MLASLGAYDARPIRSLTQEDPIGLAGGVNLYGFAAGAPVNFGDAFGLCPDGLKDNPEACLAWDKQEEEKNAKKRGGPSGLDRAKVAAWLRTNAGATSQGLCANYCRRALEAGGYDMSGHPRAAGDYGPFLKSLGASRVATENYVPETNDIAVFDKTTAHPYGHIQIYDGTRWISDFIQPRFAPYRDPVPYTIYRFDN